LPAGCIRSQRTWQWSVRGSLSVAKGGQSAALSL
jgi:hypothetical protein